MNDFFENTMSCASFHDQELGFSDDNQFCEGITGGLGNRQAMAIFNLAWDEFFFWDGRLMVSFNSDYLNNKNFSEPH